MSVKIPVHVEQVDLPEAYSKINEAQVCRTCTHGANRMWHISPLEKIARLSEGEALDEIKCHPTDNRKSNRILATTKTKGRVVALDAQSNIATRAIVDSCGQSIRPVCKGCDRFIPVQVEVPYLKTPAPAVPGKAPAKVVWITDPDTGKGNAISTDGSPVSWWKVTVGGSCGLPADGIVKDGVRVLCDPLPRKVNIEAPSCANCNWLDFAGEQWQTDHLTINENAQLTPWERDQANQSAGEGMSPRMAQGIALRRKQTQPWGRSYWFRAFLLKEGMHRGIYKYKVRFEEQPDTEVILTEDYRFTVHRTDNPNVVAVEILMPHHRQLGLSDHLWHNPLEWPRPAKASLVEPDLGYLAKVDCPRCVTTKTRTRPCYHHAKAPRRDIATGDIIYDNPEGFNPIWVYPEHGRLQVEMHEGAVRVVDGNGNLPVTYSGSEQLANIGTFRMALSGLLLAAAKLDGDQGVTAVQEQYKALLRPQRRYGKGVAIRPNWYANGGTEPAKPRCTHPGGLDLRKVFADSFGSERTDWNFDTGAYNTMAVEEELRVGMRQHHLTPQRLQEEIMSSDAAHPNFDPSSNSVIHPEIDPMSQVEVWTHVELLGIGGMTDMDGNPVTDVGEFMDALDDEVMIGEGRTMSKRQQMFGYAMSRGYFGKRSGGDKMAMPSLDNDMVIFGDDPDEQRDIDPSWRCPECDRRYEQDELVDYFYPVCGDCGADLYKNHNAREVSNPRQGGGVGNALIADSDATQRRQRLAATMCPNWVLKGSTHIGLANTKGAEAPAEAPVFIEPDPVEVIKVKQLSLTAEQTAHNKAFWAENDKVLEARTTYMDAHPDTPMTELVKLFPRPKGSVYQPTSAGSLAKVGSM